MNKTPAICMRAVRQNGLALMYIPFATRDLCMAAVKQNGLALQFIKKESQDEEMCRTAVLNDPEAAAFCFCII
jgi:hypothetical protein